MLYSKDYKRRAKESLDGNFGKALLAVIMMSVSTEATFVVAGPIELGSTSLFLSLSRKKEGEVSQIFRGFADNFVKSFLTYLLRAVYVFLWTLLFVIPGIVKSYAYALNMFLLADNPEMGPNDALDRSRELMSGNKWRLFCLDLSFLGWALLAVITCGITLIYSAPYYMMARTEFYRSVINDSGAAYTDKTEATVSETQTLPEAPSDNM